MWYNLLAEKAEMLEPELLLGAFTFVLGALVVFAGMIILVLFVSAMGKALNKDKAEKPAKEEVKEEVVVQEPVQSVSDDEIPEDVRVAIIAAIACYYDGMQAKNEFTVKKIKKLRN